MPSRRGSSTWARVVVGTAAGALAVGLTLVPTPAQATVAISGLAAVDTSFNESGATCDGTGGSESVGSFTSNGQTKTRSTSGNGTITNSGDAGDNTTWSASSKITVKSSQTATTSDLSFSGTLEAEVDAILGSSSACGPEAYASATTQSLLTVDTAGWLTVTATAPARTEFGFTLIALPAALVLPIGIEGIGQTSYTGTIWVDAGQYYVVVGAALTADVDPATSAGPSLSAKVKGSVAVRPAGAATKAASGPGKAYVSLPGGVSCVDGTAAVPFTAKASKASSATFFVNGKKKSKISNPQPGTAVVLKGVGGTRSSTVKVVVDPGQGKSVAVTRSYLACT